MTELYQHAATVFMGFFAIMNPIANTAVFAGLVGDRSQAEQAKTAIKAIVVAFVVVAVFAAIGKLIFQLFGLTLPALRIAGGVLVFLIGYRMLQGLHSEVHHPKSVREGASESNPNEPPPDVAVSPLALPILAGPGTLATAMNYAAAGGYAEILITIGAFAVLCVITLLCFLAGQRLIALLGQSGLEVVTRIMGLIMAVIGVQMLIEGVQSAAGAR